MQRPIVRRSILARVFSHSVLGLVALGCAAPSVAPPSGSPGPSSIPSQIAPSGTASASPIAASASPKASATANVPSPVVRPSFDVAAALATTYESTIYRPAFRVRLPDDWTAIERDPTAFQMYFGEEVYEITIDHTFQKPETAATAMARLLRPPALTPAGDPEPITIGGQAGLTVVVDASAPVQWSDSGYHTNAANLRVRLAAVPVEGGETVSIFVVAYTSAREFPAVDAIALRILATLEWVAAS